MPFARVSRLGPMFARRARRTSLTLACLAAFASIPSTFVASAHASDDIVALFRAFSNPNDLPSWATGFRVVGGAKYDRTESPTGAFDAEGVKYGRSHYELDGVNDYLQLTALANAGSDDGVTVRAWFHPSSVSGTRAIVSNTQWGGYSLRIVNGKVVGEVNIDGTYHRITSTASVRSSMWNQATLVADLDDLDTAAPVVQLTLVLNGSRTFKEVGLSGAPRIRNSTVAPCIGAEPNADGKATSQFFKGLIEGAVVRNYPIELDDIDDIQGDAVWLFTPPAEDGTNLGGEPSYWDHQRTNDEASETVDNRYADSGASRTRFEHKKVAIHGLVPFMNDGYIVQGMASSCEGAATCNDERLFVSMYWKNSSEAGETAGDLGLKETNASLIVELDPKKQYQPKACLKLRGVPNEEDPRKSEPNASHVAGLGFSKEKLYVVTAGKALRYALPTSSQSKCEDAVAEDEWPISRHGSLSFSGGYLVATEYCNDKPPNLNDGPVPDKIDDAISPMYCNHRALSYVYELAADGELVEVATYAVPDYTEGLEFYDPEGSSIAKPGPRAELIVSNVGGHFDRFPAANALCTGTQASGKCERFTDAQLASNGKRLFVGRYSQDTSFNGTRVYSTSESGARYAQRGKGNPPRLFPFVFSVVPTPSGWDTVPPIYLDPGIPSFPLPPPPPPIVPLPPIPPIVLLPPRPPEGFVDFASNQEISGWAKDPDTSGPIPVHIYIDGVFRADVLADLYRPDLQGTYGFNWTPPKLSPGEHRVEVYAIGLNQARQSDGYNPPLHGSPASYYDWDFVKPGNNGTVSCSTFCEGAQWGEVGGCVGAVRSDNGQRLSCFDRPGLLSGELTCECERGFIKPGNNGTVSCNTFCDGAQWGPVGRCVGAERSDTGQRFSCANYPGFLGDHQLTCQCVPKLYIQ